MDKTKMQDNAERRWRMLENRKLRLAVRAGVLPVTELRQKIKFPVFGFKDGSLSVFRMYENTSRLSVTDIGEWIFYDAETRLVCPKNAPPLVGWRKQMRCHFLGKWLIDVPVNGWIWFDLKHPVEVRKDEVIQRLKKCLSQSGVTPVTDDLGELFSLLGVRNTPPW